MQRLRHNFMNRVNVTVVCSAIACSAGVSVTAEGVNVIAPHFQNRSELLNSFKMLAGTDLFSHDVIFILKKWSNQLRVEIKRPISASLGLNGRKSSKSLAIITYRRGIDSVTLTRNVSASEGRLRAELVGEIFVWMRANHESIHEFELRIESIKSSHYSVAILPIPYTPDVELQLRITRTKTRKFHIEEAHIFGKLTMLYN